MRKQINELAQLLDESLKIALVDKKVIKAFTEKKKADGKKLTTDGGRLDGQWMGGRGIAEWKGGKIHFSDLGSKAAQTVEKAVRKEAPKNWLAEEMLDEANYSKGLELRGQIRRGEDELGLEELDLPSEDSIMDDGGKYNVKMKKAVKMLDAIRKLRQDYAKMRVW